MALARSAADPPGPQAPAHAGHRPRSPLKDLLSDLVRMVVSDPEAVKVDQFEEDDGTVVLELSVAEDDYGRIIGRGGRTANALRQVIKAAAVREERRVLLDIVD